MEGIERICGNCRLYNERDGVCSVIVVKEGENYEITTDPNDACHWERAEMESNQLIHLEMHSAPTPYFREKLREELDIPIEVKQMRAWSNGKDGFIEG